MNPPEDVHQAVSPCFSGGSLCSSHTGDSGACVAGSVDSIDSTPDISHDATLNSDATHARRSSDSIEPRLMCLNSVMGDPMLVWLLSELGELTVMVHDLGRVAASLSSLPLIERRGDPPLTVARRCLASIWKCMGALLVTSPLLPAWKTSLSLSISLSVSVSFKLQLSCYDQDYWSFA